MKYAYLRGSQPLLQWNSGPPASSRTAPSASLGSLSGNSLSGTSLSGTTLSKSTLPAPGAPEPLDVTPGMPAMSGCSCHGSCGCGGGMGDVEIKLGTGALFAIGVVAGFAAMRLYKRSKRRR